MRTFKATSGPFQERPYYEAGDVERICTRELRDAGLYPEKPAAIRIDRFIEKRFKVTPTYEEMAESVLGWTKFGSMGVEAIVVARSLGEATNVVRERRHSSTLAHEAGHGLLHSHLFRPGADNGSLFPKGSDVEPSRILCRDGHTASASPRRGYDGRWWEVQANMAMAALLLPRLLVEESLTPLLTKGSLGRGTLEAHHREDAVYLLSATFAVNPIMARIRLAEIFPDTDGTQLTL
jgi:hypothetical protein